MNYPFVQDTQNAHLWWGDQAVLAWRDQMGFPAWDDQTGFFPVAQDEQIWEDQMDFPAWQWWDDQTGFFPVAQDEQIWEDQMDYPVYQENQMIETPYHYQAMMHRMVLERECMMRIFADFPCAE